MANVFTKPVRSFVTRAQGRRGVLPFVLVAGGLLCVGELLFLAFFRRVSLDEGWYLWASKLAYGGKVLYRDFAYTQTPLLPYVYGFFQQVWGEGLVQGRVTSLLFAVPAWGLSVAVAHRIGGPRGAFYTLLLLGTSLGSAAFFVYTATYALAAFWLSAAFFVAVDGLPLGDIRRSVLATLFLCLAVATRLSVLAALPPFAFFLLYTSRRLRSTWIVAGTAVVSLALLFGPFALLAGPQMVYNVLGFHTEGAVGFASQLDVVRTIAITTVIDYAVPLALSLVGIVAAWGHRQGWWRARPPLASVAPVIAIVTIWAGLFAAHLLPRTTGSYYNSLQAPLIYLAAGVSLAWLMNTIGGRRRWLLVAIVLILNGGLQIRLLTREGLIDRPLRPALREVQEAASFLEHYLHPGDTFVSFNTQVALEAGLDVPDGMEMSIFSYHPTWSDEQVRRYGGINNNRLLALIEDPTSAAVALTSFDIEMLTGMRQAILDAVYQRYRWAITVPGIGPHGQDLYIYLPPQFEPPTPQTPLAVELADELALLGYDAGSVERNDAAHLRLGLYWQAMQTPGAAYTVFTQILDADGHLVVGWDNPPCHRTCPTDSWLPGEVVRDEYWLPLASLQPGVQYRLQVGMYDPATEERLAVAGPAAAADAIHLAALSLSPTGDLRLDPAKADGDTR